MKPEHLSKAVGDQFADKSIVQHYGFRPDYTSEVVHFLSNALSINGMDVLDIGTGTGEVAIPLSELGHEVVGVDPSYEMIQAAKTKNSDVSFINSYIEEFESSKRFNLFVAANSIHWADWAIAFPVLKSVAHPGAKLAIVTGGDVAIEGLQNEILELVKTYSTTQNFKPYCVVTLLKEGGYIANPVTTNMPASAVSQQTEDYIASFHARNGFSLDRMKPHLAQAFDNELKDLLVEVGFSEQVTGQVTYSVTLADLA